MILEIARFTILLRTHFGNIYDFGNCVFVMFPKKLILKIIMPLITVDFYIYKELKLEILITLVISNSYKREMLLEMEIIQYPKKKKREPSSNESS